MGMIRLTLPSLTRAAGIAIVCLGLAFLRAVPVAASTSTSCGSWHIQPSARVSFLDGGALTGVAAVSSNDVWAVGNQSISDRAYIDHWNGRRWTAQRLNASYGLFGIAAKPAAGMWAVGSQNSDRALILKWNGTSWLHVTSPEPPGITPGATVRLTSVAVISRSDVWAAGFWEYAPRDGPGAESLIEHWNGKRWRISSSDEPSIQFMGMATVSANDVWVVGPGDAERWNGASWSSPATNAANLFAVSALSGRDVWAVGETARYPVAAKIERWNGRKWTSFQNPGAGAALTGVSAVSKDDVWAVGYYATPLETKTSFMEHWNGSKWSLVTAPDSGIGDQFTAIATLPGGHAWAVGSYLDERGGTGSLAQRLDVSGWRVLSPASPSFSTGSLSSVTAIDENDAWDVGSYESLGGIRSFVERWNGSRWSLLPPPALPSWAINYDEMHWGAEDQPGYTGSAASPDVELAAITASSPDDVWIGGWYQQIRGLGDIVTILEHWNGKRWSVTVTKDVSIYSSYPASFAAVNALASSGPKQVWAAGMTSRPFYAEQSAWPFLQEWNGRSWTGSGASLAGNGDPDSGAIQALSIDSAGNVWAAGEFDSEPVVEDNVGGVWAQVSGIRLPSGQGTFSSIDALSPSSAWAIGTQNKARTPSAVSTLIEHWNGSSWTVTPVVLGSMTTSLNAVAGGQASGVWAVGARYNSNAAHQTIIEHWNGSAWVRNSFKVNGEGFYGAAGFGNTVWAVGGRTQFGGPDSIYTSGDQITPASPLIATYTACGS